MPGIVFLKGADMRTWHSLIAIVPVLFLASAICLAGQTSGRPQADVATAQLAIEGKFILSLVLEDERAQPIALVSSEGAEVTINRSAQAEPKSATELINLPAEGQTVSLAPGRYRWNSVIVTDKGKGVKFSGQNRRGDWFYLNRGATKTLEIGGPLQQKVIISRSGAVLDLSYKLLGAGGEEYSPHQSLPSPQKSERPEPPQLSIYKADAKIHSGSFRYG